MDDVCYCENSYRAMQEIFSCLLEKSRISLPVLVTACALGYIWTASKHQKDMQRQVCILEDDVRMIKKENLHIYDEIRRLKTSCSDTELLSSLARTCDRSRSKFKHCPLVEIGYREQSPNRDRCSSRKIKKRKVRKSICYKEKERNDEPLSLSSPDVNKHLNFGMSMQSCDSNCSPLHNAISEWSPNADSTKMCQDSLDEALCCPRSVQKEKLSPKSGKQRICCPVDTNEDRTSKMSSSRPFSRSRSPGTKIKFSDNCTSCDYSTSKTPKFDFLKSIDNHKHKAKDNESSFKCSSFKCPGFSNDSKCEAHKDLTFTPKCGNTEVKTGRRPEKSMFIDDFCCPSKATDRTIRTIDRTEQFKLKMSKDLNLPESTKCSTARCSNTISPFLNSTIQSNKSDLEIFNHNRGGKCFQSNH